MCSSCKNKGFDETIAKALRAKTITAQSNNTL